MQKTLSLSLIFTFHFSLFAFFVNPSMHFHTLLYIRTREGKNPSKNVPQYIFFCTAV